MPQQLRLTHATGVAVLSTLGAELMQWCCVGRDLIWTGDARFWPRRAPVLFPFCGWLNGGRFRHKGREYASPVHGFAPDAEFSVEQSSASHVRFGLRDSEQSRAQFPFAFRLSVDVTLGDAGLRYSFTVENPGDEPLPYALGFHPGFLWPFDGGAKEGYRILFERAEQPQAVKVAPGGLFSNAMLPLPLHDRTLDIAAALQAQDSLPLMQTASGALAFVAPSGARIEMAGEGFANWVLWSRPGAGYLCIEPWTGQGDPVGFAGQISEKPGMILLPPGARRSHATTMRFMNAGI